MKMKIVGTTFALFSGGHGVQELPLIHQVLLVHFWGHKFAINSRLHKGGTLSALILHAAGAPAGREASRLFLAPPCHNLCPEASVIWGTGLGSSSARDSDGDRFSRGVGSSSTQGVSRPSISMGF
jgi:hypothetical protein